MLNARRIHAGETERQIMLLAMEDVTKQKLLEDQLKEYTRKLNVEVAKRTSELERRVKELEKINKKITKRKK